MRFAFVTLALAALVSASPAPGGVTAAVAPSGGPPPGCSENYQGNFTISPANITSSASGSGLSTRDITLTISLKDGVLTDSEGRTGYIASNYQFQYDHPPQAGAIYTSGFSVCANGSLALGDDACWWSCPSGGFSNLYTEKIGEQCHEVTLQISGGSRSSPVPKVHGSGTAAPGSATKAPTAAPTSECTEIVDGQPQCTTSPAQATPTASCTEYVDGQPQCPTATPAPSPAATTACSVFSDGQPQCPTGAAAPSSYTGAPIGPNPNAGVSLKAQRGILGLLVGLLLAALF